MSVATRGHEVLEGLSFSIDVGNGYYSYGTYCVSCAISYYASNFLIDNEMKKLLDHFKQQLSDQQSLIEKQAKVIEILKVSNDFYADKYNWDDDNIDNIDTELRKEIYQEKVLIFYEGGKKARLAQKQVEEIDNLQYFIDELDIVIYPLLKQNRGGIMSEENNQLTFQTTENGALGLTTLKEQLA